MEGTREDQRATVTVDGDGIISKWDDAVTEVAGYWADEALGRSSMSSFHLYCGVAIGTGSTGRCSGAG